MHDHRVGRGDVQTALHDRRGQQHIVFAVVKRVHPVVELARRHLAMGRHHRDLGHLVPQERLDLGQVGNPRHHVETLSATIMFAQERLADRHAVEFAHIGPDRQPVDRRRADD